MLVINRYENRQTGKVTIQAHVIKGKKLIKSYAPCCHSLIDMIAQNYSFYMLCDVDYYSKLSNVKIVNVKWFFKGEMKWALNVWNSVLYMKLKTYYQLNYSAQWSIVTA